MAFTFVIELSINCALVSWQNHILHSCSHQVRHRHFDKFSIHKHFNLTYFKATLSYQHLHRGQFGDHVNVNYLKTKKEKEICKFLNYRGATLPTIC